MTLRSFAAAVAVSGWAMAAALSAQAATPAPRPVATAPSAAHPLPQTMWRRPVVRESLWRTVVESQATPVLDEARGQVVCGTGEGEVIAIDLANVQTRWRYRHHAPIESVAALWQPPGTTTGGRILVGAKDGSFAALDASCGKRVWHIELDGEARAAAAFGSREHASKIYITTAANQLFCVDATDGHTLWTAGRPPPVAMTVLGHAGALAQGDRIYTSFSDGFAMAVSASDAEVIWQRPLSLGAGRFRDADATPVALGEQTVAFASLTDGVYALAAETGATVWQYPLQNVAHLSCGPCTGDASGRLYAGDAEGRVVALAADTGRVVWQAALAPEPIRGVYAAGDTLLVVSSSDGLQALRAADGKAVGSLALGGRPGGELAVGESHLAHLSGQGALLVWKRLNSAAPNAASTTRRPPNAKPFSARPHTR